MNSRRLFGWSALGMTFTTSSALSVYTLSKSYFHFGTTFSGTGAFRLAAGRSAGPAEASISPPMNAVSTPVAHS